jgi:hypothetical protein
MEPTGRTLYQYTKDQFKRWRQDTKDFYTVLDGIQQQQVYSFLDDVLQTIFRNPPQALLPSPLPTGADRTGRVTEEQRYTIKSFYTFDFGGNTHTVAEEDRFEAMRDYLMHRWVPLT